MRAALPRLRWHPAFWLGAVAVALALVVTQWYPNPDVDEGVTMATAMRVAHGERLYTDVFEFYPPGSFFLVAGIFFVFGTSYFAAKVATLLLTLATAWALDRIAARFCPRGWYRLAVQALWVAMLPLVPLVNHNHLAQLASIWAVWALLEAYGRRRLGWWAAAGVLAGVAGLMLQTRGAAVALAGVAALLVVRAWRPALAYAAGLAASLLPLLAWPLPLLWQHLVAFPASHYLASNFLSPRLLLLAFALLAATGAAALVVHPRGRGYWLLWLAAVLTLASVGARADPIHLAAVAWPLPVLYLALLDPLARWSHGVWRMLATAGAAYVGVLAAAVLLGYVTAFAGLWWAATPPMPWPARLALRDPFWATVAAAVDRHSDPGEPIFATPYLPMLYVVAQRPNISRFNVLLSQLHPPEFFAETAERLRARRPQVVVRQLQSFAVRHGFHRDGTVVDAEINAHYRVVEEWPQIGLQVLVPLQLQPEPR